MKYFYNIPKTALQTKSYFIFLSLIFFFGVTKAQPLAGNYNVGNGQAYSTITSAVADLLAKGVSGPVIFTLTDTSYTSGETFPITIKSFANSSSTNTVVIQPSSASTNVTIRSSNNLATIDLNEVDFLTIDGRPGSSGTNIVLHIINSNDSGVAIRFKNDATNNTIQYCDVQGKNIVAAPDLNTAGGVIFFSTAKAGGSGNDWNVVTYCNIHGIGTDSSTFPTLGVCAFGTYANNSSSCNHFCTVSYCNIYDIYNKSKSSRHMMISSGNTYWHILNNHLYQTIPLNIGSSSAIYSGIFIHPWSSNEGSFLVSNNVIGGNNSSGTGMLSISGSSGYTFYGIMLYLESGAVSSVQNNTITNISLASSSVFEMVGIYTNGNMRIGTTTGNIIGSKTGTPGIILNAPASGIFTGIRTSGNNTDSISVLNNSVSGIILNGLSPNFIGIDAYMGKILISGDTIGSPTIANSINATSSTSTAYIQYIKGINIQNSKATIENNLIANMNTNTIFTNSQQATMAGIIIGNTAGSCTLNKNIIRNLSSAAQTTNSGPYCPVMGIVYLAQTSPAIISGNIIHTLKLTHANTTATTNLTGLYYGGPTGFNNIIENNFIHNLSVTSDDTSLTYIKGMDLNSGNATIKNNMIRLGLDENGANMKKAILIHGINESGGVNNIDFNSIYIGGDSVVNGSSNSYAFASSVTNASRQIENNIFVNRRTNYTSTGIHYAAQLIADSGFSINANDYWTGPSFLAHWNNTDIHSLASWLIATSQDSLSVSVDPNFKNPIGSADNLDLHIDTTSTTNSYLESGGLFIAGIAKDFDDDTRPGPGNSIYGGGSRPDIGADEFDGRPAPQIMSTSEAQICGPGSATLGAMASIGKVYWYSGLYGGAVLDSGNIFITPYLSVNTIYYAEAANGAIKSAVRIAVKVMVKPVPVITGTIPPSRCGPGTVFLNATSNSGILNWYSSSSGGVSLHTGPTYGILTLTTTTTYYVEASLNGCVSLRTPVIATINIIPTITSSSSGSSCGPSNIVLHAVASSGNVIWYSAATGGTPIDSGTSFTTPLISSSTTYYAEAQSNSCTSVSRSAVLATINPYPTINSTTPANGCTYDILTLSASASAGTVYWFAVSTGGSSLGTGNSYITPSLITTTTYYVEATVNGCTSLMRTPVIATIEQRPSIDSVQSDSSCGPASLILHASASIGTIRWFTDSIGGILITSGSVCVTPFLNATTKYYVETRNTNCSSLRMPVIAKIKSIPIINTTSSAHACHPSTLTISATASNGIITWYDVITGGSALHTGNTFTTPVLNASFTYYVETNDNGCKSLIRRPVDATIYPSLNKSTTLNKFTITATESGLNYQWVDCNNGYQVITGANSQSYTATQSGSYAVILRSSDCTDTSACIQVNVIGMNAKVDKEHIRISPNPTIAFIILKCPIASVNSKFIMTDALGRIVLNGIISEENYRIDLQNISPGLYILTVGENRELFKVVKSGN